jgi:excisionase family DNA binding protein
MTVRPLEQQTYLPESTEQVADVLGFIREHENTHEAATAPRYFLSGADESHHVEIPAAVYRALVQVLETMTAGKAVTVVPQSQLLTTQQAADLLGVSRPTVVKLVDAGALPASTPGKRRRMIALDDLLEYRARRRDAQYQALLATSIDDDEDMEDPAVAAARFRRVRAEVAEKRRAPRPPGRVGTG